MNRFFLVLPLLLLLSCSSQQEHSRNNDSEPPKTYYVGLEGDKIVFCGIDYPSIVDERPTDKFEVRSKIGRFNVSQHERCVAESEKALAELELLVKKANTSVLLNSLRGDWPKAGGIDYYVARDGNGVILEELLLRRPISDELLNEFDSKSGVFLGVSGPPWHGMRSWLDSQP